MSWTKILTARNSITKKTVISKRCPQLDGYWEKCKISRKLGLFTTYKKLYYLKKDLAYLSRSFVAEITAIMTICRDYLCRGSGSRDYRPHPKKRVPLTQQTWVCNGHIFSSILDVVNRKKWETVRGGERERERERVSEANQIFYD